VKLKDLYNFLDQVSPFDTQESWDNSGLNVGNFGDTVEKIYISLDIDNEIVEKVESNSLIITHHPLIFKPLKNIDFDSFPSSMIKKLIKKDISLVSMHTNFDKSHLNKFVCSDILGYKNFSQSDFVCTVDVDMEFDEFFDDIKEKLDLDYKKVVKVKDKIKSFAITTGAGASLLPYIKADCFITGDIKYHDAMYAREKGISMIDIGHYESEKYFSEILYKDIKDLNIDIEILNTNNPFDYK
jgi:dinuclear metal center YbgI/SA1388 family protein